MPFKFIIESNMSKSKFLLVLLLSCVAVCCVKEEIRLKEVVRIDPEKVGLYPFIMPIDFSKNGDSRGTKAVDSLYVFEFSYSMLDSSKTVQKEVLPGVVYTQTPLKGTLYCKTKSEFFFQGESSDEPVRANMFYIKKEFCAQDSIAERIITMIPTVEMSECDSLASYLNMPDFSGTVITSSLEGVPIDVWGVRNGRIFCCTFDDVRDDNAFVKLSFFYPLDMFGDNFATKSGVDTTLVDGGDIEECIVVSYKRKKEDTNEEEDMEVRVEPKNSLNDGPEGGGSPSEEPNEEIAGGVFYTLTIVSEFCNGESLTKVTRHAAKSKVLCEAKSSSDKSCLFFCWMQDGSLYSYDKKFSIKMNENKYFGAIFHSAEDGDCYEMAKLMTDSIHMMKIDSMWRYTERNGVEAGIAQEANGNYFKLESGSKGSINCDLEPGKKYISIDHTHPRLNCFPSAKDFFTLNAKYNKKFIKDWKTFSFNIIAGSSIMSLRFNDSTRLRNYLRDIVMQHSGSIKSASLHFDTKIMGPIIEKMTIEEGVYDYDVGLRMLLPLLEDMGLYVIFLDELRGNLNRRIFRINPETGNLIVKTCFE